MLSKISDLQERQIINIADGKCLGGVKDIEIDIERGCIRALILPGNSGLWGMLQSRDEIVIPWSCVVRIGIDVVLIDMAELGGEKPRKLRKSQADEEEALWQKELAQYQNELGL